MKKILLLFLFATGIHSATLLFSEESTEEQPVDIFWSSESWAALGFEYGNFIEAYRGGGSYTGSPGIHFSGYRFFNDKRYGIFASSLIAFPVRGFDETDGYITKTNYGDYLFRIQIGLLAGIAFRSDITERLKWKWAVGFNFLMTTLIFTETDHGYGYILGNAAVTLQTLSLGIGGDVGVKFDVTDTFFWSIGSIFTLNFANHGKADISFERSSYTASHSEWVKNYIMFSARPYITLGLNLRFQGKYTLYKTP